MSAPPSWNRIEVRRFRGFDNIFLEGLGNFNVLVGANDTGKTSLLEAMFLLAGSGNPDLPNSIQAFRDFPTRNFDDLTYLFHNCNLAQGIKFQAHTVDPDSTRKLVITASRQVPQKLGVAIQEPGLRSAREFPATGPSTDLSHDHRNLLYELTLSTPGDYSPKSFSGALSIRGNEKVINAVEGMRNTIIPARFLSNQFKSDADAVGNVVVRKKKEELLQYLQVVNPRIQDIGVSGSHIFLDTDLPMMLPINLFGSGMARACAIIANCILGAYRILLIDEVSSGLHYKALSPLLKALLRFSVQNNTQVFVTTHNLDVLRSLKELLSLKDLAGAPERVACYALQRDKGGQVRAYRYGHEDLDHCIRHGIEIR